MQKQANDWFGSSKKRQQRLFSRKERRDEGIVIDDIIAAIQNSCVRITDHADEEANDDGLSFDEIYFSVMHGEIIETYLDDKPYPSCLVMGTNFSGEPIHSVWAYNSANGWAILITVYRPDPSR